MTYKAKINGIISAQMRNMYQLYVAPKGDKNNEKDRARGMRSIVKTMLGAAAMLPMAAMATVTVYVGGGGVRDEGSARKRGVNVQVFSNCVRRAMAARDANPLKMGLLRGLSTNLSAVSVVC